MTLIRVQAHCKLIRNDFLKSPGNVQYHSVRFMAFMWPDRGIETWVLNTLPGSFKGDHEGISSESAQRPAR